MSAALAQVIDGTSPSRQDGVVEIETSFPGIGPWSRRGSHAGGRGLHVVRAERTGARGRPGERCPVPGLRGAVPTGRGLAVGAVRAGADPETGASAGPARVPGE